MLSKAVKTRMRFNRMRQRQRTSATFMAKLSKAIVDAFGYEPWNDTRVIAWSAKSREPTEEEKKLPGYFPGSFLVDIKIMRSAPRGPRVALPQPLVLEDFDTVDPEALLKSAKKMEFNANLPLHSPAEIPLYDAAATKRLQESMRNVTGLVDDAGQPQMSLKGAVAKVTGTDLKISGFTGDPSTLPVLTDEVTDPEVIKRLSSLAVVKGLTDADLVQQMYPKGHTFWKFDGPELNPDKFTPEEVARSKAENAEKEDMFPGFTIPEDFIKSQMKHPTLTAVMPKEAPARVMGNVTEGIYPVRDNDDKS